MDWTDVTKLFRDRFASELEPAAVNGLLELASTTASGQRLVICLLIDLEAGSVTMSQIKPVLESIACAGDPVTAFGLAVQSASNLSELTCASPHRSVTPDARYVRVMELSSFITYYAGVSRNLTLAAEDVARVRHEYFAEPPVTRLGDVTAVWSGYNSVVWVMPYDEFQLIVTEAADGAATELNDRLGLGYVMGVGENGLPEIVAIQYPSDATCDCKQPTTFDARWVASNYYVSLASADNWGQTQPCSGSGGGIRERVHKMIPALTNDFTISRIGIANVPALNEDSLLDEAYARLRTAVAGNGVRN